MYNELKHAKSPCSAVNFGSVENKKTKKKDGAKSYATKHYGTSLGPAARKITRHALHVFVDMDHAHSMHSLC